MFPKVPYSVIVKWRTEKCWLKMIFLFQAMQSARKYWRYYNHIFKITGRGRLYQSINGIGNICLVLKIVAIPVVTSIIRCMQFGRLLIDAIFNG